MPLVVNSYIMTHHRTNIVMVVLHFEGNFMFKNSYLCYQAKIINKSCNLKHRYQKHVIFGFKYEICFVDSLRLRVLSATTW